MDVLLARYFDGDLDDREAREFLEAVETNPDLERELRAFELVLSTGGKLPDPPIPAGFTENVMTRVVEENPPVRAAENPAFWKPRWIRVTAAAAVIAIAFVGGWLSGDGHRALPDSQGLPRITTNTGTPAVLPASFNQTSVAGDGVRYIRFVYIPSGPAVDQVTVVGSFNDWDTESTPMLQKNGVWSTVLVLPPGSYEYMFVENGDVWVTDPMAIHTRDDGFGGKNAVLDVEI